MTTTVSTPAARSHRFGWLMSVTVCLALAAASTGRAENAWEFIASPNAGAFSNQLFGADASSPQDVWAVGVSTDSLLDKPDTLAMRWDGQAWTIVPTPNPNPSLQSNRLYDVTAIGPGDAWAVGSATLGPTTSPLLLHWDGAQWTVDSADELPPSSAHAVHALAADDVWVLGAITQGGTGFGTLAAHYDGSSWTPVNVPNAAFGGLQFQGVDGIVSDDVWAAGFENPGSGIFAPLLAHWDGNEWTSMNPEPVGGCTLHGIEMIASDDVWAVGRCPVTGNGDQPYAVHWDGTSWTQAPMPLFADGHARLEGVVARAGDDVWAAGTNGDQNGVPRPLIMHYDGVAWLEVATPSSGGSHEWFHGMGRAPDGEIWAVGQYFTGFETSTLTARLAPVTAGGPPGAVSGLALTKNGSDVVLEWSPSCSAAATDYAVYEGNLGDFGSHVPAVCSTAGATSAQVTPLDGGWYFLIIPLVDQHEGSYGQSSSGQNRVWPGSACGTVQDLSGCP